MTLYAIESSTIDEKTATALVCFAELLASFRVDYLDALATISIDRTTDCAPVCLNGQRGVS